MEDVGSALHRAVLVLRDAAEDVHGDAVPQALLDGLQAVVPGVATTWSELDYRRQVLLAHQTSAQSCDVPADADLDAFWRLADDVLPCRYLYAGPVPRPEVVTWSDFLSDRAFLSSRVYRELYAPWGERYVVVVPLPSAPGCTRALMVARDDRCFSTRERDLLTLLRPHLHDAHRRHQRRKARVPALTARQWEVLRLVAAGRGTDEVARALFVTEATVRKHLENAYARLGVSSRRLPWRGPSGRRSRRT